MSKNFLSEFPSNITASAVVMMLMPALCMADSLMFQANLERTGLYNDVGPEENPELLWKFDAGSAVFSTPLVYDGIVYFDLTQQQWTLV